MLQAAGSQKGVAASAIATWFTFTPDGQQAWIGGGDAVVVDGGFWLMGRSPFLALVGDVGEIQVLQITLEN